MIAVLYLAQTDSMTECFSTHMAACTTFSLFSRLSIVMQFNYILVTPPTKQQTVVITDLGQIQIDYQLQMKVKTDKKKHGFFNCDLH